MKKDNSFIRLLILLLLTTAFCIGMYYLPKKIFNIEIKRVDLLSDLRTKRNQNQLMDSLRAQLFISDSLALSEKIQNDSIHEEENISSEILAERDSLYRIFNSSNQDSSLIPFEDYTQGRTGLRNFYKALEASLANKKSVRIGFLGDSFIEGDIVVGDFRSEMQQKFGGKGVGLVPISSVAALFRPTITSTEEGWKTYSILTDHTKSYTISGTEFQPESEKASVSLELTNYLSHLAPVNSVKFIYSSTQPCKSLLVTNKDTLNITLNASKELCQYEYENSDVRKVSFELSNASSLQSLGIVMEDKSGVSVDNFSLRGNSGLVLARMDSLKCKELNKIRSYNLLILQYGLNVASDSTLNYNWYAAKMKSVITHLKKCFPEADIVLLGVSDRSHQNEGNFETMPAVLSLLHSQRKLAQQTNIVFWNTFAAMGGENSMVKFVEKNWASKDYTHLSFRGGKEISRALFKAILHEKEFYDKAERIKD